MSIKRFRICITIALLFLFVASTQYSRFLIILYEQATGTSANPIIHLLSSISFFMFIFCVTYCTWRRVPVVRMSPIWTILTLFMSLTGFSVVYNIPWYGLNALYENEYSFYWLTASVLFMIFYNKSISFKNSSRLMKVAWLGVYSASTMLAWRLLEHFSDFFIVFPGGYENVKTIRQHLMIVEMPNFLPEYIFQTPVNAILLTVVAGGLLFIYFNTKQQPEIKISKS